MDVLIQHVDFLDFVSAGISVLDDKLWQITFFSSFRDV